MRRYRACWMFADGAVTYGFASGDMNDALLAERRARDAGAIKTWIERYDRKRSWQPVGEAK